MDKQPRSSGRFAPGPDSRRNKLGRPKGAAGLARYIAEQTDGGRELVDRLLTLSRDDRAPTRERFAAAVHLLDRAVGKPMQPSEIVMAGQIDVQAILALPPAARLQAIDAARARIALPEPENDETEGDPAGEETA